jgi:hypothetical protein
MQNSLPALPRVLRQKHTPHLSIASPPDSLKALEAVLLTC